MYRGVRLSIALVAQLAGCSQILGLEPATQRPSDAMTSPSDAPFDGPIDAPVTGCAGYCSTITANCSGTNAQFGGASAMAALDHCMATCQTWNISGDMTGPTQGCHIYHAVLASTAQPTVHCPIAGPAGDQLNGAGVCGAPCANFCALDIAVCTGANAAYTSMNDCLSACAAFEKTHPYVVDTTSFPSTTPLGDSLACRLYHATLAASSALSQAQCPLTRMTAPSACTGTPTP